MKRVLSLLLVCVLLMFSFAGCAKPADPAVNSAEPVQGSVVPAPDSAEPAIPEIPKTTIKIVQEPYYVCSAASIGIEKGWYKELGISFDPEPYGTVITGEDTTQFVASQKGDMIDQPTVQMMGAIKDMPPVKTFVFNSIFYGSVVLGQPDSKTVQDFKNEGKSTEEAIKLAVQQLKSANFAYDGTASSNSFVSSALGLGGLRRMI